jgi:hypothetical protein
MLTYGSVAAVSLMVNATPLMREAMSRILTVCSACFAFIAFLGFAPAAAAETPQIAAVPSASHPPIPNGLKVTCLANPNGTAPSPTCPVVKYQGITTWAYSYIDNRYSMALVGYDETNHVVSNEEKPGARYVVSATVNNANQTVTFLGQASKTVNASWAELGAKAVIATVPANTPPPVPQGLKVACMTNGNSLTPSPTCPVVKYMGYTTWAYSYIDNRVSLAFVTYGPNNAVVRNVEMKGTRYVWKMVSDPVKMTVTASGQSNTAVTAPWAQFGP